MADAARQGVKALVRVLRLAQTDRLRERREGLGLSQGDVGRWVGVDPAQVSRWESGRQKPRPEHAIALLELLDGDAS